MPTDDRSPHSGFGLTGRQTRRAAPALLYERSHWFACSTRSRSEKKACALLGSTGIETYLPLIQRERRWADRRVRVSFPLFPGYLFARFNLTQLDAVLRLPPLAKVVSMNGYPTPVREDEIEQVRSLVDRANAAGIEPRPVDFVQPGQEVIVTDGPFKGLRGVLLERRGRARVAVRLTAIRQAVSVEMDRRVLEPAPAADRGRFGRPRRRSTRGTPSPEIIR